jgi:transposase-like protein
VKDHVEQRSRVSTGAWVSYGKLVDDGYRHNAEVGAKLPIIHREFANLKTWLQGTHHGRIERQHLQTYLNEFVFRHNRRFWRFSAFQTVLRLGIDQGPQEYDDLYKADEYGRNGHVAGVVER